MNYILKIISLLLIFSCQKKEVREFGMSNPIKDLASKSRMLEKLEYVKDDQMAAFDEFTTPVIINKEDGLVVAKTAKMKGAKCNIDQNINFMVVTIDHNVNNLFDTGDEIIISAIEDDSVLVNINPFSVKDKNPVLVKCLDKIYELTVDASMEKVSVVEVETQTYDLMYPCKLPDLKVADITTNEVQALDTYLDSNTLLLIITTSANCNPCYDQLADYLNSDRIQNDVNIVLFFPENTNRIDIAEYQNITSNTYPKISLLKGDLNKFMKNYGLVTFPDGVLINEGGMILNNHYTLSKVR